MSNRTCPGIPFTTCIEIMANKILFISCALNSRVFASVPARRQKVSGGGLSRGEKEASITRGYAFYDALSALTRTQAAYPNKRDGLQDRRNKDAAKRTLGVTSLRLSFFVFSRTAEYFAIPILACKGRMFWSNSQVPLHYFLRIFAAAFLIFS